MNRETRKKRTLIALGISSALLLAPGCASSGISDAQRHELQIELRLLEDVIYELEGEVKDKEQQVNAAKRENQLIKEELKALSDQRMKAANDESRDVLPAAPGTHQPIDRHVDPHKPGRMGTIEEPKIEAPALNLPPPFPPDNQDGSAIQPSPYRRVQYTAEEQTELAQATTPTQEEAAAPQRNVLENHWKAATIAPPSAVDHITIHPRLSGGHNTDRRPGDDGIQVIFAPRDAQEQPLQVRGAISVVLVDPELNARSARWEYSTDESQQFFKKSLLAGEAYHLDLRWPINPPANAEQELHVRFTTADGQRHEASSKIILQLPGAKVATPQQQPPPRRAEVPQRMTGIPTQASPQTPTLAPPQDNTNDPPPVWTGPSGGPSLTAPQVAGSPYTESPANRPPSINITVPDIGGVPEAGKDNQRLTITQRIQQRRAARQRGDSVPSLEETGNLALPTVEAPALPGMSMPNGAVPNINVPSLNIPGTMPTQPGTLPQQPTKPSGWRSWFSTTPAPTTAPAYQSAPPAQKPDGFVIVPVNPAANSAAPLNNVPGVSPLPMLPPTQLAAPQFPNDSSRTATKPEWKPYR